MADPTLYFPRPALYAQLKGALAAAAVVLAAVAVASPAYAPFIDDSVPAGLPLRCPESKEPCLRPDIIRGTTTYGPKGENWTPPPTEAERKAEMDAIAEAFFKPKVETIELGAERGQPGAHLPPRYEALPIPTGSSDLISDLEYRIHVLERGPR